MDNDYAVESDLAISDVIEVLQSADPNFIENSQQSKSKMNHEPRVEIIEQPAPKALRFRYECEGRSAGSIPGVHATNENKSFPTIKIVNFTGRCMAVVSCVTKDQPYMVHPHNLVGKDGKQGVCTAAVDTETMTCQLTNLGIQCVKKKEVERSLEVRRRLRIDPFKGGYDHGSQPSNIDLNAVRLCFHVFAEGDEPGKFTRPLPPVVSEIIYDKKANTDLQIIRLSDVSCSVAGGKEMILLCEKVAKDDIEVHFTEEKDGQRVWLEKGEFQPSDVHRQYAIPFRTPAYSNIHVQSEVKVKIQLVRPSDGACSEPRDFTYLPLDSATILVKRKQSKYSDTPNAKRHAASSSVERTVQAPLPSMSQHYQQHVKMEPQESNAFPNMSPRHPNVSHSPHQMNVLQQTFPSSHAMPQLYANPQAQERFTPVINFPSAFAGTSQATFGQPQADFVAPVSAIFNNQQPQQGLINNLSAPTGVPSSSVIADLDNQNIFADDQNISDNLSGQLRLCGINSNDPGEQMISVENMSTDSFCRRYLGGE